MAHGKPAGADDGTEEGQNHQQQDYLECTHDGLE
jgi:hypothetical protein